MANPTIPVPPPLWSALQSESVRTGSYPRELLVEFMAAYWARFVAERIDRALSGTGGTVTVDSRRKDELSP